MKHFYLLAIALKNLRNNTLKALAVMVPLTFIIAIISGFSFYMAGVKRDAFLAVRYFPDILLQQQVGGRTESLFWERYEKILARIDGLESYFPRVWGHINFTDRRNRNKTFVVMGLDARHVQSGQLLDTSIELGRALLPDDRRKGIVGKALAAALTCSVGDTVEIYSPGNDFKVPVEIVGIFNSSVQIYTADLLLVPIETAREIFGFYATDESSDIPIFLENPQYADELAREIAGRIEGARPLTRQVMMSMTEQSFGRKSGFFHLLWFILLVNVILIAWSLMSQVSFGMQKDIGILKAIGWDIGHIMELKVLETLVMGVLSTVSGLLLGGAYMYFDAPGMKKFIIGWADIYPDFPVPLHIEASTVMLIVAIGILPLLAGTLLPVWRLSIIDPDEIIKK